MAEVRNLAIKTGSVRRLAKELVLYREEEQREQERVQKMKTDSADPYDIKHAVRRSKSTDPDQQIIIYSPFIHRKTS